MNENVIPAILQQIESSEKPLVVMGIGIPASGKSTLLGEVAWKSGPNIRRIDVDAIRNRFIRLRAGRKLAEFIDQEMYTQVQDDLVTQQLALVDGTNIESDRRVTDIRRYRDLGAVCVGAVFINMPKEVALQRNAEREVRVTSLCIEQMHASLDQQVPTINEGFDWIIFVKPDEYTVTPRV